MVTRTPSVEADIAAIERDQLGAARGASEANQQQRPIARGFGRLG